ncbi:AsnC family transcriptional regulator [Candidatus Marsarchaeota archaeon]|jgi:Lrp/AsnC family transcriptional regulator for asnA, asnC and gidA|nr:AsnC family transcriptional regulator [Candidatus Marsarchaeota archaeon]MCL5092577.1 AsnC family transcriptional regulator [Candidatus Marsarchaeota archaeon]
MINIIDKKIIDLLNKNGRMSAMDMAKTLNVSKGTVRNRLIGLYKENIIFGYNARVRYKMLGMDEAIVGFEISPEFYTKALAAIKALDFVKEVYRTSGDHSAMARIVSDADEIDMHIESLESIEGIKKVYPSFIQEIIK